MCRKARWWCKRSRRGDEHGADKNGSSAVRHLLGSRSTVPRGNPHGWKLNKLTIKNEIGEMRLRLGFAFILISKKLKQSLVVKVRFAVISFWSSQAAITMSLGGCFFFRLDQEGHQLHQLLLSAYAVLMELIPPPGKKKVGGGARLKVNEGVLTR